MKKFLLDFFRPIDSLIFNYLVKVGFIKCVDPMTAVAVGGQLLGGIFGARSARKAAKRRADAIAKAYEQFRDPNELISDAYGGQGFYGDETMQTILGRERALMPEFQQLAAQRARGIRNLQTESKERQLDILGQYGDRIRGTLEDPRLAAIADADLAEAERLTRATADPLGFEGRHEQLTKIYGMGNTTGIGLDQSTLARATLGRED